MACMHAASARQLPALNSNLIESRQCQAFRLSSRQLRRQAARSLLCERRKSCNTTKQSASRQKLSCQRLYAQSARQEEADLRADYGALSEKLEILAQEVHGKLQGTSLYLVGMMGSGKSTVGGLVGRYLKYPLLDTDKLVEQSAKATVSKIFAEEGEDAFRDMETEVLNQLMPFTQCVVATGGGAVLRRKNWGYMQHGVVIWLDGSPELLASHVVGQQGGTRSRPLIFSNTDVKEQEALDQAEEEQSNPDEYRQTVDKLSRILDERHGKYSYADVRVPLKSEEHDSLAAESILIAYRVLKAVKDKLNSSAEEREAKKQFEIKGANDVPKSVQVKQSPASSNGHTED